MGTQNAKYTCRAAKVANLTKTEKERIKTNEYRKQRNAALAAL